MIFFLVLDLSQIVAVGKAVLSPPIGVLARSLSSPLAVQYWC